MANLFSNYAKIAFDNDKCDTATYLQIQDSIDTDNLMIISRNIHFLIIDKFVRIRNNLATLWQLYQLIFVIYRTFLCTAYLDETLELAVLTVQLTQAR